MFGGHPRRLSCDCLLGYGGASWVSGGILGVLMGVVGLLERCVRALQPARVGGLLDSGGRVTKISPPWDGVRVFQDV